MSTLAPCCGFSSRSRGRLCHSPRATGSSRLVEIESFRTVDRTRLLGVLDDEQTVTKRALDAIHVASAEILAAEAPGEPLEFWTHDGRQATAARSRGLAVFGT